MPARIPRPGTLRTGTFLPLLLSLWLVGLSPTSPASSTATFKISLQIPERLVVQLPQGDDRIIPLCVLSEGVAYYSLTTHRLAPLDAYPPAADRRSPILQAARTLDDCAARAPRLQVAIGQYLQINAH